MNHLTVDLGERSYPILNARGLLNSVDQWSKYLSKQVLIVTNTTLLEQYGKPLHEKLSASLDKVEVLALPDGEEHKNLNVLNLIFDRLLERGFNRNCTLIALGGGVIGDITGFAAASYQRGVKFVQIPTTLLAQVDSSVGGKTGVNHILGKNMIGAFYQPQAVVIDLDVFGSLPDKELSAGLAEVIKYGLIYDAKFLSWLEENSAGIMSRNLDLLAAAIKRSCEIKAAVVAIDEKESGIRAILNLGHTFGHAIESHQGYGKWLHGEAVAAGMMMACDLSQRHGWISVEDCTRAHDLCVAYNLPVRPPTNMSRDDFFKYMMLDKKVLNSKLRLVLLQAVGQAVVTEEFDHNLLEETLAHFCAI